MSLDKIGLKITLQSSTEVRLVPGSAVHVYRDKQGSAGPGFVNQDRDWEISPFGPVNEIGSDQCKTNPKNGDNGMCI
jgi:hypothetical protein